MVSKLLHYEVLERLGEGARSTIYAVIDPQTRQTFALKHVLRETQKDIRFIEQMQDEFEISKLFTHPNLRRSFELKVVKSLLMKVTEAFLVMELFDGRALDVRPPRSVLEAIDTFLLTAQGLKAMHAFGYVHCDLKPNNILRNDRGVVKVIDFGQSCKVGTVKERIQGTPDYIAPEQVDRKPVTAQTDVFNLGATLYWCLTNQVIPTKYTVNRKGENSFLLDTTIAQPADLNPRVGISLSNLVMEMVSTRAQKRPPDMDAVITRLELAKYSLLKQQANPMAQTG